MAAAGNEGQQVPGRKPHGGCSFPSGGSAAAEKQQGSGREPQGG